MTTQQHTTENHPEPIGFTDAGLGDRISFLTANNGFDGDGDLRERVGTVLTKTAKVIVVACETNLIGDTARITRAKWNERNVRRIEKAGRLPYRAESVKVIDHGHTVTALYIPDPEQALDPEQVLANITDRSKYEAVELVATAQKFTKAGGATFSGWIVDGSGNHTDPIKTKAEALHELNHVIASYFGPSEPKVFDHVADEMHALRHEVQAPAQLDDEEVWDEPRAELEGDELYALRPGVVVEAKTVQGTRCRVRLAAAPTHSTDGTAFLEGPKAELYEVDPASVTLIGVMPRKGDTVHAQAKTYTEPKSAAELPEGTRVRCAAGPNEGRYGRVNGLDVGRVNNPEHRNHGRAYVGVEWDAVAGDMGGNRRSRPFVDELRLVGVSKPMRRKLDREPWPGNPGSTVISDGRGVDAVLTSTIVILAGVPGKRTDEQRIARAVSLAMPGLDFHTNTTSLSAIRVYAKRAEHEGRDDEAVLARNDDIAEALVRAGFYVSRRGVGQAVYASVESSSHASNRTCEIADHKGEPAPWIAVISAGHALEAPYACRACVRRLVESERALNDADPERPYLVRMWDAQGQTLKVADDRQALDFRATAGRDEARTMAEQSPAEGWRDGELVPVRRVTVDRVLFNRGGSEVRDVEMILATGPRPELDELDDCTCVEFCDEDPRSACSLSGRPHVHPASQGAGFGPCPVHPDRDGDA